MIGNSNRFLPYLFATTVLLCTTIGCFKVPNRPPQVSVTAPLNNAIVFSNETITLKATATDPDGITQVVFFDNGKLLGTDKTTPYEWALARPTVGAHSITAKATDSKGLMAESQVVNFTTRGALDLALDQVIQPSVSMTTTQIFPVLVVRNWGKTVVTEAVIEYTLDKQAPLSYIWRGIAEGNGGQNTINLPALRNENGYHSMRFSILKVNGLTDEDPNNNTKTRDFVSTIVNIPPSVILGKPSSPVTVFQDEPYTFEASATDRDGTVKRVEFYRDQILMGEKTTPPYTLTQVNLPLGIYKITAKAIDDRDSATVSNPIAFTVLPAYDIGLVQIASPTSVITTQQITPNFLVKNYGNKIISSFNAYYQLNDTGKIHLFNWLGNIAPSTQMTVILPALRNENGTYSLKIWLENPNNQTDGNPSNNSRTTNFRSDIFNTAPSVNLTAPVGTVTIRTAQAYTFKAWATDRDGWVKHLAFYRGSVLMGVDSISPYEITLPSLPVGTHSITVVATDDRLLATTSVATTLIVTAGAPPPGFVDTDTTTSSPPLNATPALQLRSNTLKIAPSVVYQWAASPNPARSFVTIDPLNLPIGTYAVALQRLDGTVLYHQNWTITAAAPPLTLTQLGELPRGWYLISVQNGAYCASQKLYLVE
jgi:hypothetical protein